jgi:hypothetical protein
MFKAIYFKGSLGFEMLKTIHFIKDFILSFIPSFSFLGSRLLPGQDLDDISIPFQIYLFQATTS